MELNLKLHPVVVSIGLVAWSVLVIVGMVIFASQLGWIDYETLGILTAIWSDLIDWFKGSVVAYATRNIFYSLQIGFLLIYDWRKRRDK